MDTKQLNSIQQRTVQYWYSDGLAEIAGSILFLLLSTYFWLMVYLPEQSPQRFILDISFVLIIFGGSFLTGKITNAAKLRITYSRTGFIQYQVDPKTKNRRRLLSLVFVSAIVAVTTILFFQVGADFNWMAAATGIVIGILTLGLLAPRIGLVRFYLYGILSAITGIIISLLGFENIFGLALFYSLAAFVLFVFGSFTLIRYLRANELFVDNLNE